MKYDMKYDADWSTGWLIDCGEQRVGQRLSYSDSSLISKNVGNFRFH